nr:MAG: replication initiator protein [Microviridae sp.]
MCLYTKYLKNPKYKANKKNGGVIPPVCDERIKYVPIACGRCMECAKAKQREWRVRLQEEIKTKQNGVFVTLTFSEEKLEEIRAKYNTRGWIRDNQCATYAVRHFLEKWRKQHKVSVRHWLVTELGSEYTERIHLHGIMWLIQREDVYKIEQIWQYGYVHIGKRKDKHGKPIYSNWVNNQTVNYITKYVNKLDEKHREYQSIILCSKGIGSEYTNKRNGDWLKNKKGETTNESYRLNDGTKVKLPIYYRNKIYSEEDKEKLWIEKLDKQERWINGIKISIKESEERFEKTREYYRRINKQLGYGDGEITEEEEQYRREMREIKNKETVEKAKRKYK